MKITSAEFFTSAPVLTALPEPTFPEIAFAGRSNVGKSSLMNMLLNRKGLVKTSGTPGKTRALNFFDVNKAMYFVDMPGYGYAKVSKSMRSTFSDLTEKYLKKRSTLVLVVQLVDSRFPPTEDDEAMLAWLLHHGIPTIGCLTKMDKVPKTKRHHSIKAALEVLKLDPDQLIPCSVTEGLGKAELWQVIEAVVKEKPFRMVDEG